MFDIFRKQRIERYAKGANGYTLSHSNKRDVIIEYLFREGVHNLADIIGVLYKLDQKIIGR